MYYYICEVCGSNFSHRNKNRRFCNRGCSDSWIRNLYISKHKKLEGKRFSRLIVLKYVYSKKKKPFYDCLCDCGKRKIICGYYLKNNTSRSCGCLISDIMRKLRKNPYIKLTTFQREVIIGELLGDGHITKAGEFQFTGISEEHRDCLSKVFNNFNPRLSEYKKGIYRITTKTNDSIREIRNKWYPKNKKRVPKDLILTPIICYHWYIGDGTLTTKSYYSSFIKISTEGFGFFGVHFLKKQLEKIGFTFSVQRYKSRKDKFKYTLYCPTDKVIKFLHYIANSKNWVYYYRYKFKAQDSRGNICFVR